MKKLTPVLVVVLLAFLTPCSAQYVNPLFSSKEPIHLRASGSIKKLRAETNDSTFVGGEFSYEKEPGQWLPIETETRVRGNFRLKNCYFPPLKLKFKKKNVENTPFQTNKSVKLVLPCNRQSNMNKLISKEYLCYQFYEAITPYHFKTRLVNLQLTETSGRKPRVFDLLGIMVEDNNKVAERVNGKVIELKGLSPATFDEKQSLRNDYFQYLIGNSDWSAVFQHNSNILFAEGVYMPIPYDFDMAIIVNADYTQSMADSEASSSKQRVYRGFCKSPSAMEDIRKEYLAKESVIQSLVDQQSTQLKDYEIKELHDFVGNFFNILKDDALFKANILEGCRKQ